jgi:hypothetical protein
MGRTCSTYGVRRGPYRGLVGKPEGRRSLGRPRLRREDNIKIDLRDFLQAKSAMAPKLDRGRFLPYPFRFINYYHKHCIQHAILAASFNVQ